MFTIIGSLADRYWPVLVSVLGAIALALFGTVWVAAADVIGMFWTVTFIVAAALLSVFGGVFMAIAQELRTQRTESELLTVMRSTIIPLAEQVIVVKKPVVGVDMENLATELALHCRALVRDKDAICDVNVYRVMSHGLDRVNRASREARISFKNTTKNTPRAIEERRTVERVVAGEVTFCPDVNSKKWQKRFSLEKKTRDYRCFISVPVFNESHKVIGMLSINSSRKGGLSDLHKSHMETAAKLYARAAATS
ncbi:hypothetical protein KZC52_07470 [Microbacterium sp. kSW2-24]|uniref:hypothetical protein n=1 Tax=Microbacterium galbinum TaxID=2851646 RepID=UPI001FFD4F84|nr:hypothetical protein [Microbacterium galbinum]MCK2022757.1 hypothetical protein [Microbacterium galbinum]